MLIKSYFQQMQDLIAQLQFVLFCNVDCDKRGLYEGFIRGEIQFNVGLSADHPIC